MAQRGPFLLIGIALGVGCAIPIRHNLPMGLATMLLDGWPALFNLTAAMLGGLAIVRRIVPDAPRSLLLATGGAIGLGLLATLAFLIGLAGGLNGVTTWGLSACLAGAGVLDLRLDLDRWRKRIEVPWTLAFPAAGFGLAIGAATFIPGALWGGEPAAYDVLSYHLQIPREWYELGRIASLDHNIFSRFPLVTEVLFLLSMHQLGGPWAGQYAAQFTNAGVLGLVIVAAFGVTRAIGGTPALAGLSAAIVGVMPWPIMLSSIGYNEPLLILASLLTAGWLGRGVASGRPRPLVIAGLVAGLGAATKYPAIPLLIGGGVIALGLTMGLFYRSMGVQPRRALMMTAGFVGAAVLFPLPWLVRNLIEFGNPVSPLAAGLFGGVDGWSAVQVERWEAAHSLPLARGPGQLWQEVVASGNFGWLLWPMTVLGLAYTAVSRRRDALPAVWMLTLVLVTWLLATHMIGRFMTVAIGPAVLLVAATRWFDRRLVTGLLATLAGLLGLGYTLVAAAGFEGDRGLLSMTDPDRSVVIGFPGPLVITTPFDPSDFERIADRDLYLVGDAEAFAYPHPTRRLHYKVVFDVPPADGALRAWLGDAIETAPDEALVVIDTANLRRFARFYGTPALDVEIAPDPASKLPSKPVLTMGQVRELLGREAAAGS